MNNSKKKSARHSAELQAADFSKLQRDGFVKFVYIYIRSSLFFVELFELQPGQERNGRVKNYSARMYFIFENDESPVKNVMCACSRDSYLQKTNGPFVCGKPQSAEFFAFLLRIIQSLSRMMFFSNAPN